MRATEAEENYLEIILILSMIQSRVRATDVAKRLDRSRASTSEALKKLKDKEHISIREDGHISLTESGNKIANATYEKYKCIYNVLRHLGVPKNIAFKDACRIEHRISEESFQMLKRQHLGDDCEYEL